MDTAPEEVPVPVPPAPPASACRFCRGAIAYDAIFCPHCGKQLKDAPLSTSIITQIGLYALSIFLPPFGLWPGIKYFRHSDPKAKNIGIAVIVLTLASTAISVWATFALLNVYLSTMNEVLNL